MTTRSCVRKLYAWVILSHLNKQPKISFSFSFFFHEGNLIITHAGISQQVHSLKNHSLKHCLLSKNKQHYSKWKLNSSILLWNSATEPVSQHLELLQNHCDFDEFCSNIFIWPRTRTESLRLRHKLGKRWKIKRGSGSQRERVETDEGWLLFCPF